MGERDSTGLIADRRAVLTALASQRSASDLRRRSNAGASPAFRRCQVEMLVVWLVQTKQQRRATGGGAKRSPQSRD